MSIKMILSVALALALASLACSVTVNLPEIRTGEPGPTVTDDILVPALDDPASTADINLEFGAGVLSLSPGEGPALLSGTATYNVPEFKPQLEINGNQVRVSNGDFKFGTIPSFEDYKNEWDLALSQDPISLRISAGAYQGRYDLGGLALHDLRITDGASDVELRFSAPNLVRMDTLRYETGASTVRLEELANANFDTLIFRSGAGDYTLDFSGELQQDASVDIKSGLSNMEIIVPQGTDARVTFTGGLANVNTRGRWRQSAGDYILDGSGPRLTIRIDMGAGSITLRSD